MKRAMVRKLTGAYIITAGTIFLSIAAPHNGDRFELLQPDGSAVPVVVWGDEFYQRVETPDGLTLVRDKETGWICYAELSTDSSELLPSDRIYRSGGGLSKSLGTSGGTSGTETPKHLKIRRNSRLRKHSEIRRQLLGTDEQTGGSDILPAPPSTGTDSPSIQPLAEVKPVTGGMTGLTILIDFSDKQATIPVDSIEDFTNKRGYTGFRNNGSVRDFYYDVSGGKLDYQNIVVGYYRAKKPKTYYDSRSAAFGNRAQELIVEALKWLNDDGFDFSVLSTYAGFTGQQNICAINILYAGSPSQGWSEGLWPHQGRLNTRTEFNGVYASKYQMSNIGSSLGIGTFCHENGHMLFSWPDLYDYGGESGGVGVYCLMCNTGTTNPIPPCAYLRDWAGWDAVTDITDLTAGTVLSQLPANMNTTFMFRNTSNRNEMFYIEARRRSGRYKTLPDSGFMIWHVDRNGSNDNEQGTARSHYLVALEQADGTLQLERGGNSGRPGDLFRKGYKDRFSDTTTPDAHWWNGSNSGMKIFNMSAVADTMSFSIGETAGKTLYTVFASADEHGSIAPSGKVSAVAGSTLKFGIRPDSGYQIDAITVDGASNAPVDTLRLESISSDHTISVVFGIKAALGIISPREFDLLYAEDTALITWRSRGVTVQGIDISLSIDGGKSFSPVKSGLAPSDTVFRWIVPNVESDSCMIRVVDSDGTPSARTGLFTIRKKPSIAVTAEALTLTVQVGTSRQQSVSVENRGTGDLHLSVTTAGQLHKVMINELSIGADADAPDAIELFNDGVDIDLSGWQLVWDDNKMTSGSYTFPNGFIFKGGTTYVINDLQSDTGDASSYMGLNVQWLFSDSLALAMTLLDAAGRGVDFVKSSGIPIMPPEGTYWRGNGIALCSAYVARVGSGDLDSARDWSCTASGSLKRLNSTQQVSATPPLLTTPPQPSTVAGNNKSGVLTLTLDATAREPGSYSDTLVIYHNDPAKPSPLQIPCMITVSVESKAVTRQKKSGHPSLTGGLIVAPNPVPPGERLYFHYQPAGDEREGELMIFNRVGDCLFRSAVDFSGVSAFNREPVLFSWLPADRGGRTLPRGTCLARLRVRKNDGSQVLFSAKIGLR